MVPRRLPAALALLAALVAAAAVGGAQEAPGTCVEGLQGSSDHDARTVTLTWTATAGANGYVVTRSLDGGAAEVVAELPATITSYNESDAPEGIVTYRVGADGVPPEDCDSVNFHFGGEPQPEPDPVCVEGLEATASDAGITLTWDPVVGAGGYDILRAEGDAALAPYAVAAPDAVAHTDADVTAGVTYRYAVSAHGIPETPCPSVQVTAVPFAPLVALALASAAGTAAFLALRRRRG